MNSDSGGEDNSKVQVHVTRHSLRLAAKEEEKQKVATRLMELKERRKKTRAIFLQTESKDVCADEKINKGKSDTDNGRYFLTLL